MLFVKLYLFLSILVTAFFLRTVNVMYFSVFSPKPVNCFFKSFCKIIIVRSIMKSFENVLRTLFWKLHMLCTALLNSSV